MSLCDVSSSSSWRDHAHNSSHIYRFTNLGNDFANVYIKASSSGNVDSR
jgi:hypothetical protein